MPIAKLKASNTADVMKTEEGNNSLDRVIRQAIGREPFVSFSRAGDSSVQWIQFLHALDQQEVPGWPFVSPLKVQLQKCEKCSREFCSTINYRRHLRVHHRLKKLEKDSKKDRESIKDRELFRAYWDKLSIEEAKEAVCFTNVMLEEVPGSSVIIALTTLIRKPGFSSLPQSYLKAGSDLLDIIQARPSRFPISSQELFSILDDASEKTFLCGAPWSVQKYIFDREAGKLGLETKNLIACASFLVEQKLVKEWIADKDAEALRCQKLLVEEEEAAQKRQAEVLEKRRKKLRQKEQRAKDKRLEDYAYAKVGTSSSEEALSPAEEFSPSAMHHNEANPVETSLDCIPLSPNTIQSPNACNNEDSEPQSRFISESIDLSTDENIDRQTAERHGHKYIISSQQQLRPKSERAMSSAYHAHTCQISRLGSPRRSWERDQRLSPTANGYRIWSRKSKIEMDESISHARTEADKYNKPDQTTNGEVLIGSISVTLGICYPPEGNPAESQDLSMIEHKPRQNNVYVKPVKTDFFQCGSNRSTTKLWRPVGHQDLKASISENDVREIDADAIVRKEGNQTMLEDFRSGIADDNTYTLVEDSLDTRSSGFSSVAARAFLEQRWKEAILSEHVKLVLSPSSESSSGLEMENHKQASSFCNAHNGAGNGLVNMEALEGTSCRGSTSKFFIQSEKGLKVKYIPKLKTAT